MPSDLSLGDVESPGSSGSYAQETERFLDRLVHDLRSAQRNVQISAELLCLRESCRQDSEAQRAVQQLEDGIAKTDAILAALSNYSFCLRPSAYTFRLVSSEMALRSALAHLQSETRETDATITFDELPQVVADRDRLSSLFRHLIANALKYRSADSPVIEVRAKPYPGHWLFSVRDNGIGMDSRYWDDVFTPFSRLQGAAIPGVGLGLSICRKIVDVHGGSIWVESTVGQGTTVFFTIPTPAAL
jgi:chemotaxis family two-component system sensor kinase Cph1